MPRGNPKIDVDEAVRLHVDEGLGAIQIGRLLGCSTGLVAYYLRQRGAQKPAKRIDWPVELMRQWYEQDGLTLQQIADRLNQNQKVVNKVAKKHGFRMRRTGPPSGENHPNWRGGRLLCKNGYVKVYCPDHPHARGRGYVWEHRLVMEQSLGRHLDPGEVVHHTNGVTDDNRLENLQLFASNGEHLAETLAGCCPQWTEEGRSRLLASAARKRQRAAIRRQSRRNAQESIGNSGRLTTEPRGSGQHPSQTVSQHDESHDGHSQD